jgi:hypothetical protein
MKMWHRGEFYNGGLNEPLDQKRACEKWGLLRVLNGNLNEGGLKIIYNKDNSIEGGSSGVQH